nr:MAG TPA: ASCH domain protein [Caudoviricetes sp.]
MAIKPILFNTEMVRAILDGRKTCTRRVIKPQPQSGLCYTYAGSHKDCIGKWTYPNRGAHKLWGEGYKLPENIKDEELSKRWNPPYHTDDILYVRETWSEGYEDGTYIYRADDKLADLPTFKESSKLIYRPSIHMPKGAARIWLRATDVRVERLQEITVDGCHREGINIETSAVTDGETLNRKHDFSLEKFETLWDSTVKKSDIDRYGWDANPWVWVIEFERCEKPEGV